MRSADSLSLHMGGDGNTGVYVATTSRLRDHTGNEMKNDLSSGQTFCECDPIDDPLTQLAQGDVFEWLESPEDPWHRHGIIVTADCDIVHRKHAGVLSYIPLLSVRDYVAAFYLPKQIAKILSRIDEGIVKEVHRLQAKNLPTYPSPVAANVAIAWVEQASSTAIADDLKATGSDRDRLVAVCEARAALVACSSSADINVHGKIAEIQSKLWKEIKSHLKDLPGDALFIRAITDRHSTGFVACLRFIRELSQSDIAIKAASLDGARARRIGRLRAPYVYRLTQMLGSVFSSIGLPDAYESARHELVELLQLHATEAGNK
jgi:hypothetical protein